MKRLIVVVTLVTIAGLSLAVLASPRQSSSTRQLTGVHARKFIEQKESQNEKFSRVRRQARAELLARGLRPTDSVTVVESLDQPSIIARAIELAIPNLRAQTYDNGSQLFIAEYWDGGAPNTWTGNIYVEDYATTDWSSINTTWDYTQLANGYEVEPEVTWLGRMETEHDGHTKVAALLGGVCDAVFPRLSAQESDLVGCDANPRVVGRAAEKAALRSIREGAFYVFGSALGGAIATGPAGFIIGGGLGLGVRFAQGYFNEMWRYYARCPR